MSRATDDASSLDTLLSKYGGSKRSIKRLAEPGESSTDDDEERGNGDEPSSQFLKEIRERAQILSRNAAKSRKAALQNVVSDESLSAASTSGGASLDVFMDIIRSAAISDGNEAKSPAPPTNDEELAAYSRDDLLQSVIPLDAAPWTAENDDTLNASRDLYKGLSIEPWGPSATETRDDNSGDGDSTSEESLHSDDDDIDGRAKDTSTSAREFGPLKPKTEVSDERELSSYVVSVTDGESDSFVEDGVVFGQHLRNRPQSQAEVFEDTGMIGYQCRQEALSDDEDSEEEDDEEGDESFNKDVNNKSPDLNISPNLPVQTSKSKHVPLSPEQNFEELTDGMGDKETFEDDFKMNDETENEPVPDAAEGFHPYEEQGGIHRISVEGLVDDSCFGMRQEIEDKTGEVGEDEVEIGDGLRGHQLVTEVGDILFGLAGSNDDASHFNLEMSASVAEDERDIDDAPSYLDVEMNENKNSDEEEDEINDALSDQRSDSTSHIPDVSFVSLDKKDVSSPDDVDLEMYAKNQDEDEKRREHPSSLHPELSSEEAQDAAVQQRVSSALDDLLGDVLIEEEMPVEHKADEDDNLLQIQELSLHTQQSFNESDASEEVVGRDEKNPEDTASFDVPSVVKEEWFDSRQDEKSVESGDNFSPLGQHSFRETGKEVEEEGDGTNPIGCSFSPGESFGSKDKRGDEKTVEEILERNFAEIERKIDDTAKYREIGIDDNLHNLGEEQQQSRDCLRSDETTTEQSRFRDITYPHIVEHSKLKSKEPTWVDLRDQSKGTLLTASILSSKPKEVSRSRSENVFSTAEKQPVYSKPNIPYAKVASFTTSSSQRKQSSCESSGMSENSQIFRAETKTHRRQERKWNFKSDADHKRSVHVSHGAGLVHVHDLATSNSKTHRPWSTQSKSLSQEFLPEQKDGNVSDEEPKGPVNVRSLIARFNSGSGNASPVASPRSDRSFDWNVFPPNARQKTRERLSSTGGSSCDERTSPPHQHQDSQSSSEGTTNSQDIPWMRELSERRKRRERGTVWGKIPP